MGARGDFAKLNRLVRGLSRMPQEYRVNVNRAFAQDLILRTTQCFTGSRDPYGETWAPLKATSGRRVGGQPLMDYGILKNSVTSPPVVTPDRISISSNEVYAAVHNYGHGAIPKRQFLPDEDRGLPEQYKRDLQVTAAAVMDDLFPGAR